MVAARATHGPTRRPCSAWFDAAASAITWLQQYISDYQTRTLGADLVPLHNTPAGQKRRQINMVLTALKLLVKLPAPNPARPLASAIDVPAETGGSR
jgi:hypothetical protein